MAIWGKLLIMPLYNFAESFIDNVVRDQIDEPARGSIVYCDLAFGYAEHSGVYVGGGEIIHLNKDGIIESVDHKEFINGTSAMSIYAACCGTTPVGSEVVARRATSMKGNYRSYNVILDNCHQFAAGCLSGDFDNSKNFLWMLKDESKNILGSDSWRVWNP